jgi:hypothetical protein
MGDVGLHVQSYLEGNGKVSNMQGSLCYDVCPTFYFCWKV